MCKILVSHASSCASVRSLLPPSPLGGGPSLLAVGSSASSAGASGASAASAEDSDALLTRDLTYATIASPLDTTSFDSGMK